MLSNLNLLVLILAVPILAHSVAPNDSCGPACNAQEEDEFALLQVHVKPARRLCNTFWVVSFGRSGSSSVQRMIAQVSTAELGGQDFTILEPCHYGDVARAFHNCSEEMHSLLKCDFSQMDRLNDWGTYWDDVQTCCEGVEYSPETASKACSEAPSRTFKTIHEHDLEYGVVPILEDIPELRVVNLVRDPRGTYQSMKDLGWQVGGFQEETRDRGYADYEYPGYDFKLGEHGENPDQLRYICSCVANMSTVSHPRIHNVRFEDILAKEEAARDVITFLGFPWNAVTEDIAKDNFPGLRPGSEWSHIDHYPADDPEIWTKSELEALSSIECQSALKGWGYPAA